VLMPRAVFAQLAGSTAPDLREFLSEYEVNGFEAEDPGLDLDIDRPEDYQKALAMAGLEARL
jgi:CTP:molybdopterin cytidylyltransferase MocA